MIALGASEWLLLFPAIGLLVWWLPKCRKPLRLAVLLLLAVILCDPQIRQRGRGLDLWLLADRSASTQSTLGLSLKEWETILQKSKGSHDRLFIVDYASEAIVRDPTAAMVLSGSLEATRTGLAISHALSLASPRRNTRLLVATDGYATEPIAPLMQRLLAQEIPLDYRIATPPHQHKDYRVAAFELPRRVQPGEAFLIEVQVQGPAGGRVPFEIGRGGSTTPLTRGELQLPPGPPGSITRVSARYSDRLGQPGGHAYHITLTPADDPHPGNNRRESWLEVTGGPRLLLVTAYQNDPLAAALVAHGFEVEVATEPEQLDSGRLQGARALLINNVAATRLGKPFLEAIDFYVRHQGGGLLMVGGKQSFGTGAYFASPIADLLPVSMELRNDQHKLAVNLAVVLDRSGSMGAASQSGETKMELANNGTARAVTLLGPNDIVSVLAVDTQPHTIVPPSIVGHQAAQLAEMIRQITPGGGGIDVYPGLKAARELLLKSQRGQRHLILFADAADADNPGEYRQLISQMNTEGISLSVIGLGGPGDKDAALLEEMATLGNGRFFLTNDASRLPAIFEQETVTIARSAFIEEPTPLNPLANWSELAARPLQWPATVDGYNLTYLQPGASAAAVAPNEENAPLLAFWQRGSGRVAAVTFPLGGDYSSTIRAWPQYGDFVQTLARWLAGEERAPGLAIHAAVEGSELKAELLFDSTWEATLARHAPRLLLAPPPDAPKRDAVELIWQRMEPGRYRATAPLEPGQLLHGAVEIGKNALPFGPLLADASREWSFDPERPLELAALSRVSGGSERLDLATIWKAPRKEERASIRHWLLPLLLLLFLLETLLHRLGRQREGEQTPKETTAIPDWLKRRRAKPAPPQPKAAPATSPEPPVSPSQLPTTPDRRERFRRARKGK